MNPGTITDFHYLDLSSNGHYAKKGKLNSGYTFQDSINQTYAMDHSCWSLQPLTFHVTHSFNNVTHHNNTLIVLLKEELDNNEYIVFDIPTGQYTAQQLLDSLNAVLELKSNVETVLELSEDGRVKFNGTATTSMSIVPSWPEQNKTSTMYELLGLNPETSYPLNYGFETMAASYINLRGPECIYVSLSGLHVSNLSVSNGDVRKDTKTDEHPLGYDVGIDDTNLFLYVPVNTEFGGVISCRVEDTYSNSIIMNDLKGEITNQLKVTLYDHRKRVLYLDDTQTCTMMFKQYHVPDPL